VDAELGTESKSSIKTPESIIDKANRLSIKAKKPWFDVEHVRDSFRFKTVISDLSQIPEVIEILHAQGYEIVEADLEKLFSPKEWGWRMIVFDLRMPNGQLVEYYIPLRGQEGSKKSGNHVLFEKWRGKDTDKFTDEDWAAFHKDVKTSYDKYQAAWEDYLEGKGQTESEAFASLSNLLASVSSKTRLKLSLRSSAEKPPLDQAPSTNLAENEPPSQASTRPSDKSLETNPSITDPSLASDANIQKNIDKTKSKFAGDILQEEKPKGPKDGWRDHLIKAREYALQLFTQEELDEAVKSVKLDWSSTKSIVKFIDNYLEKPEKITTFVETDQKDGNTDQRTDLSPLGEDATGVDAGQPTGTAEGTVSGRDIEREGGEESRVGDEPPVQSDQRTERKPGHSEGTGTGVDRTGRRNEPRRPGTDAEQGVSEDNERSDLSITPEDQNHSIPPDDVIVPAGEISKIQANIKAIRLLKKLEAQDRNPTPEEKKVLAKYVGWGGLSTVLTKNWYSDNWQKKYEKHFNQLTGLLTPEEMQAAKESTISAYYTDRRVIDAMWKMAEKLGFKGGRVLEPGAGIGHFFGLMPKHLQNSTSLRGIELDQISGRILEKLYPQANIGVHGFEDMNDPNNTFDLAITNVPFGDIHVYDKGEKEIAKQFNLHNYKKHEEG